MALHMDIPSRDPISPSPMCWQGMSNSLRDFAVAFGQINGGRVKGSR